jgi:hypothetical protein
MRLRVSSRLRLSSPSNLRDAAALKGSVSSGRPTKSACPFWCAEQARKSPSCWIARVRIFQFNPLAQPAEPPYADPHVRWCEGRTGDRTPYPYLMRGVSSLTVVSAWDSRILSNSRSRPRKPHSMRVTRMSLPWTFVSIPSGERRSEPWTTAPRARTLPGSGAYFKGS